MIPNENTRLKSRPGDLQRQLSRGSNQPIQRSFSREDDKSEELIINKSGPTTDELAVGEEPSKIQRQLSNSSQPRIPFERQLSTGQNQGYKTMPTTKKEYSLAKDETQTILKPLESLLMKEKEKSTKGRKIKKIFTPKLIKKKIEKESELLEDKGKSNSGFWSLKRRKDKFRQGSSLSNTSNSSIASITLNDQPEPLLPEVNGISTNPQEEETSVELQTSQEEEKVLTNSEPTFDKSGSTTDELVEEEKPAQKDFYSIVYDVEVSTSSKSNEALNETAENLRKQKKKSREIEVITILPNSLNWRNSPKSLILDCKDV